MAVKYFFFLLSLSAFVPIKCRYIILKLFSNTDKCCNINNSLANTFTPLPAPINSITGQIPVVNMLTVRALPAGFITSPVWNQDCTKRVPFRAPYALHLHLQPQKKDARRGAATSKEEEPPDSNSGSPDDSEETGWEPLFQFFIIYLFYFCQLTNPAESLGCIYSITPLECDNIPVIYTFKP